MSGSLGRELGIAPGARVLVRSPNWVGDAVMALPFLDALRRALPGCPVTIAARPSCADIARMVPGADVLEYDDRGRHSGVRGRLGLARELGRRGFRAAFLLPNSFSSALLPFLARIPIRVGYSKDARGLLLTHRVPWDGAARSAHRARAYLGLLQRFGVECEGPPRLPAPVTGADRDEAAAVLAGRGAGPGERLIGIAPGAVGPSRRWPPERFGETAALLAARLGARPLFLGAPADRPAGDAAADVAGGDSINLVGCSPLRLLPALIERCVLFLSNDSGAAHVASLTRTPTLVLFGAGNEAITRPLGENVTVLRLTLECTPCESNTCSRGDLACLIGLSAGQVAASALGLLHRS